MHGLSRLQQKILVQSDRSLQVSNKQLINRSLKPSRHRIELNRISLKPSRQRTKQPCRLLRNSSRAALWKLTTSLHFGRRENITRPKQSVKFQ